MLCIKAYPMTLTARLAPAAPLAVLATASLSATALAQTAAPALEELDPSHGVRTQAAGPGRLQVDGDVERGPYPLADPANAPLVTLAHPPVLDSTPLIDEPVTGVGNDDLWDGACNEKQPCRAGETSK